MNSFRAAELLVNSGERHDLATLVREPKPQPMVKDAVVFAPMPDKEFLLAEAVRRLIAEHPGSGAQPKD